ncbi:MAG: glycosyltransferase [Gemmatimonadaceae bacterium]
MKSKPRFSRWDYPVFCALTAVHLSVLAVVFLRWLENGNSGVANPLVLVVLGTVMLQFVLWEWRWLALPLMRVPQPSAARQGVRVGVAVTFVPAAESIEMLERTVAALVAMQSPHDTWVLDEGDDIRVRRLCERTGAKHYSRFGKSRYQQQDGRFKSGTKYGNYNAWLEETGYVSYDIVVSFDSDHVAKPDYLVQVIGYFDDEQIGYVQPSQVYSNQGASFVARAAAEETYAYFSSVQMTAYAVGYPIVVGCHNAHRVTALKEIGGFAAHEADDMVMTLMYRTHGWRGVFVPKILARGLTPVSWSSYLNQQRRWARSVLDFKLRVFPKHARRLPFLERVLTYVHGIYYLRGPMIGLQLALVTLMLATSWLPVGSGSGLIWGVGAIWLTVFMCDLFRQRFYLDVKNEWGLHWRSAFVSLVKWPYFILALGDALRAQYGTYILTPKGKPASKAVGFGIVHAVVGAVVGTAWLIHLAIAPASFLPIHIAAAVAVLTSFMAAITSTWTFAPTYVASTQRVVRREVPLRRDVGVAVPLSVEPLPALARHMSPLARPSSEEQLRALG